MPLPLTQGQNDFRTGTIIASNQGTWANLSANNSQSWSTMTSWVTEPSPYLVWNTPIVDLGSSQTFNLNIRADIVGNVTYTVYTSDGDFDGTETTRVITASATNIPAFHGRYVAVSANIATTGSLQTIRSWVINPNTQKLEFALNSVSTATLAGTSASRQIDLGRDVSYVYNLQMTPHYTESGSLYVADGYVADDYMSSTFIRGAFPQIVDKTDGSANICVVDNEGNFVDATLDIRVQALPEQYRRGNDVLTR